MSALVCNYINRVSEALPLCHMNSKNFAYCYLARELYFALGIDLALFNISASARAESSSVPAFAVRNPIPQELGLHGARLGMNLEKREFSNQIDFMLYCAGVLCITAKVKTEHAFPPLLEHNF